MKIIEGIKLDFEDVLICPQRSTLDSRKDASLERTVGFYHSPQIWTGIPIICSNMTCVGTKTMGLALSKYKCITCLHKFYSYETLEEFYLRSDVDPLYIWVSIGKSEEDLEKICLLQKKLPIGKILNVCIDVPNGYLESFVKFCSKVRHRLPSSIILAGNVTTPEMVQELIIHGGVDICKLQISPGSACRTRVVTGVGYGTISCIDECSAVAHGLKHKEKRLGLVCSDGGCKQPGDICKGFAAGADFIMLGGMLSGTEQCDEAEWEYLNNRVYKYIPPTKTEVVNNGQLVGFLASSATHYIATDDESLNGKIQSLGTKHKMKFYGMSTHYSQQKYKGKQEEYRASEGDVFYVDYKGNVDDVLKEIFGGLRSCCTYVGASSIKDLPKCATFIRVNRR